MPEQPTHEGVAALARELPRVSYRYGGLRAALRWIFKGVSADEED